MTDEEIWHDLYCSALRNPDLSRSNADLRLIADGGLEEHRKRFPVSGFAPGTRPVPGDGSANAR